VPPPAAPPVLRPRPQPAPPHADDVTSHSHSHSFGRSQSYGQGQGQPHSRSLGSLLAALPQLTAAASHGEERYGAPPPPAYPRPHLPDAYRPSLLLGAWGQHPAGPQMTIAQAAAAFAPPPPAERLSGLESLLDAILQASTPLCDHGRPSLRSLCLPVRVGVTKDGQGCGSGRRPLAAAAY
jgi:hypothetical protein